MAPLEFFRQKNVNHLVQKCNCKKLSNNLSFQIALHNCSLLRYKDQFFNQRFFSLNHFGLENFLRKMIWTYFYATNT